MTGIAAEFPGVPHRYCDNHFLRDVAKPVLEADSHAKVQMRKKVRGLRKIEQAVLERRHRELRGCAKRVPQPHDGDHETVSRRHRRADSAGAVVLDYCAAVRGILNDDQGGPLHPPGLRMAEALDEVRRIDPTKLGREKRGFAEKQLGRLGRLHRPRTERSPSRARDDPRATSRTSRRWPRPSNPEGESCAESPGKFEELIDRFERDEDPIRQQMAGVMISFLAGLFVGEGKFEEIKDNLDLGAMVSLAQESRAADSRSSPRGGSDRSRRADIGPAHWTPTSRIPGRSPRTICCRIARPENHPANERR